MPLLVYLFGLPGSGKSHVGRMLAKYFNFQFIEGDDCLPVDLLSTLRDALELTAEQRVRFYTAIGDKVAGQIAANLTKGSPRDIVVSQATFKNIHRKLFIERFPEASLWQVTAPDVVRAERALPCTPSIPCSVEAIAARCRQDAASFEASTHPCETLLNDGRGDALGTDLLVTRIRALLTNLRPAPTPAQLTVGSVLTFSGIDR